MAGMARLAKPAESRLRGRSVVGFSTLVTGTSSTPPALSARVHMPVDKGAQNHVITVLTHRDRSFDTSSFRTNRCGRAVCVPRLAFYAALHVQPDARPC